MPQRQFGVAAKRLPFFIDRRAYQPEFSLSAVDVVVPLIRHARHPHHLAFVPTDDRLLGKTIRARGRAKRANAKP